MKNPLRNIFEFKKYSILTRIVIYLLFYTLAFSGIMVGWSGSAELLSAANDIDVFLGLLASVGVVALILLVAQVTISLVKEVSENIIKKIINN